MRRWALCCCRGRDGVHPEEAGPGSTGSTGRNGLPENQTCWFCCESTLSVRAFRAASIDVALLLEQLAFEQLALMQR